MNDREIAAWERWASAETCGDVTQQAIDAMEFWRERIRHPEEREDVAWCCLARQLWPSVVAEWAATAAFEMAIVCTVWPDPLADALRPGRERRAQR
jgi:hypothetical protein